jgi:hypothetical protein
VQSGAKTVTTSIIIDVSVSSLKILAGDVQTYHNVTNDSYLKVGPIIVSLNEKNGNNILSDAMPTEHTFVGGEFKNYHHNIIVVQKSNLIDTLSKVRTALIQGRKNDVPINHKSIQLRMLKILILFQLQCQRRKYLLGLICATMILLKIKEANDHLMIPKSFQGCGIPSFPVRVQPGIQEHSTLKQMPKSHTTSN